MSGLANRGGMQQMVRPSGDRFPIDVVFVVDATESMTSLLERVKIRVLTLDAALRDELERSKRVLDSLRVKLIVFRDLYDDPHSAFEITNFFDLPTQRSEFESVASTHWAEMKEEWENVWLETRTETGLLDLTWEEVVKTLVATI